MTLLHHCFSSSTAQTHACRIPRCPPTSADPKLAPMHPAVSLIAENVVKHNQLFAPLLFAVFTTIANVHTPVQHSLLIASLSWLLIWTLVIFRVGIFSNTSTQCRRTSLLAGAFLALSQICDRAACDKQGIWATKVALRLLMVGS